MNNLLAVPEENKEFAELKDKMFDRLYGVRVFEKYSCDCYGIAKMFSDYFKNKFKFCIDTKAWMVYEDGRWIPDDNGKTVSIYLMAFLEALKKTQPDAYLAVLSKILGNVSSRKKIIEDCASFLGIKATEFDARPHLLNCKNGTLDMDTMVFRGHDPEDLITMIVNADYVPAAVSPLWDKFIMDITCDRKSLIEYLQKVLGYALTGDLTRQTSWLFYGPTKRNGKSTLCETFAALLGEYACPLDSHVLEYDPRIGEHNDEGLAATRGKRFIVVAEPKKGMRIDVQKYKLMTGGNTICVSRKYEHQIKFKIIGKLVIDTNYLPAMGNDMDLFESGRIKVIPFDRHFAENEQDITLPEKLLAPEVLSAVLAWAVEGYKKIKDNPDWILNEPAEVKNATQEYIDSCDKVSNFLGDMLNNGVLRREEHGSFSGAIAYDLYRKWCTDSGVYPEAKSKFYDLLKRKGYFKADMKVKNIDGTVSRYTNMLYGYVENKASDNPTEAA